jgi:acyl-CoA dehydrogenase
MDFDIPKELEPILEVVRDFRERELMPLEKDFLLDGELDLSVRQSLEAKAKALGLWALEVPEADGGAGLGLLACALINAEIAQCAIPFAFPGSPEPLLHFGTQAQREKYYYPVIRGERRGVYAFTEPDAGSDVQGIKTRAIKDGNEWVLNGTKIYITDAHRADYCFVFAVTEPGKGAKGGISCFIVDYDFPGFTLGRRIRTMGDDRDPYELIFQDCRVPEENLLGPLGQAFSLGDQQLTHGRVILASVCLGLAERSIAYAKDWAKQRKAFGKTIGEFQAIQWFLADSLVELEAAKMLVYKAAWLHDTGKPIRTEAHAAKLYATEMAQRVTDRCLQILGGLGYTLDTPIQSMYRHVRVKRIGHGTTEINRWMIARSMLKS